MEHSPVQLTFSVIPNQHLKWRKRYQVEIAIPIAEAPNILRTGGAFPPLYAIAMGNEVENKVAIELSLEALDMFATGPTDISVRKDDAHLYIVVRDIAPLMPAAWQTNEPKIVAGEITDTPYSFLVSFGI